jgi:predicted ester cyclase
MRNEVEDLIAEGDKVVVRWRLLGTHQGNFRVIMLKGSAIYRVSDDKLIERWVVYDLQV